VHDGAQGPLASKGAQHAELNSPGHMGMALVEGGQGGTLRCAQQTRKASCTHLDRLKPHVRLLRLPPLVVLARRGDDVWPQRVSQLLRHGGSAAAASTCLFAYLLWCFSSYLRCLFMISESGNNWRWCTRSVSLTMDECGPCSVPQRSRPRAGPARRPPSCTQLPSQWQQRRGAGTHAL